MARIPQPPALWIGYNFYRLIAAVFMLWCLISQFISLVDEMKMLKAIGAAQGTSAKLPVGLTAASVNSTGSATRKTPSGSPTSTTSASMQYSTAYSEFSVTSATTIRRVSTIPPSSEPTSLGTSVSDIAPDTGSGQGGIGAGTGFGSPSSSDVSDGSDAGGASVGSSPLIGGGESFKRRRSMRWDRRLVSDERLIQESPDAQDDLDGVRGARIVRRADGDRGNDAKKGNEKEDKGNKQGGEDGQHGTKADGGVIGPWRPEVPAFAAISRILLVALLSILVMAQMGVPEIWLYDHLPYIGPQSTPVLLGSAQLFVAVETLRVPGQAINLIGAWGVLAIGCFNILSGAFLWYRARQLPPNPPPALWFSHAVRLLYWRPLPPFYAPLFRSEPSLEDQEAWVEGEPEEVEDEKTVQNTLSNSQTASADPRSSTMDAHMRQQGQTSRAHATDARKMQRQTAKSSRQPRSGAPDQVAAADTLSDIALGPTSQHDTGILGAHTLNGSSVQPYPMSTDPASRYNLDPLAHTDVRQGGYPTFTGTGIGQPGRQIPAGTLAIDPTSGNVVGMNIDEEEEEVAVVKLAERVSVYDSTSGSSTLGTKRAKSTERKRAKPSRGTHERDDSRERQRGRDEKRSRADKPSDLAMIDEERPGTVHSLLPPVNILRDTGPVPAVPGARRKPVASNNPGGRGHRRTPSIGKQGMSEDGSHRISDPTAPADHRPELAYSNSSSSVGSGYSGLAYDREPRGLTERSRLPDPMRGASASSPANPADIPKTPLLTPSPTPTPVSSAQVNHAQIATVKSAGKFEFPASSLTAHHGPSSNAVADRSRGKRGTMIGPIFTRPVELNMSDSEDELDVDDATTATGRDRRVSSLEDEIRDLLSPPPTAHRASRQSIIPPGPGSLAQHIKAIEQQQEQQKQLLSAQQSAESGRIDAVYGHGAEQDADRPPSALKGSSSSVTPPRERPPRHLRFALSPIPGTPVATAANASAEMDPAPRPQARGKRDRSISKRTNGEATEDSASLTIPGIGLTLALPAGLVGGISPGTSPKPASASDENRKHRKGERVKGMEKRREKNA